MLVLIDLGAVVKNLELHIRWKEPVQFRHERVNLVDRVDDIRIRRLEQDENDGRVLVVIASRQSVACAGGNLCDVADANDIAILHFHDQRCVIGRFIDLAVRSYDR